MAKLEEVYTRLTQNKRQMRELRKMIQDELSHSERYGELKDEVKRLREEMKGIENEVKANSRHEADLIDDLKLEIQTDTELLADIALNMYVNSETVEIVDEFDQPWHPQFKVTFKKSN